jgi:hypothetical protein
MPLLTDLANAIRKDDPRSLFCLVEFGNHGTIVVSPSGKGYPISYDRGTHVEVVLRRHNTNRVIFFNDSGKQGDSEERLFNQFGYWYNKYGNRTTYITVITAASPCRRVCAQAIRNVADWYKNTITSWCVFFHAPYEPDTHSTSIGEVLALLNNDADPKMLCGPLHSTFVDQSTHYG